jgi:tRNA-Thr(GGU) m(6)t(6)A37 methyltransferase TsaA
VIEPVVYHPIGVIRTPYVRKYDAPRQPNIDDRVDVSVVELLPNENFEQALRDLEGCDRIWLVTHFHQVTGWKPMVLTPRDRTKHGVFATRSPHRPNPIGLTCVELVAVRGLHLTVRGTDLLDGTPVLDIKPYVAYADAYPDSGLAWLDAASMATPYTVQVSPSAPELPADVLRHARRVLSQDPLPHPYRRIEAATDGTFILAVREHRIRFSIHDQTVTIL